ncbi:MAG: hypothetical protein A2506_09840 [Elusimicrobia bacterium RIFOXYD12_FULL_66_9]|nr:MAG: hypothetical protein A2506_09840 [Elusimicrobia bacterium RIFOXYD12_FULL_66_9]
MREFMNIAKALADENRTRILMFLQNGELCVCQAIEMLGLAPSTVSKHLTVLYQAGLVESRKEGRWIYYRLPEAPAPCVREALEWFRSSLGDEPRVQEDAKRLATVLKASREDLCARYKT